MSQADRMLDHILVLRCKAGDAAAFDDLVMRHHARVLCYLRRMVGNGKAEDVAQDVWLAVWRSLPRLKQGDAFSVWLFRTARGKAVDALRRHGRERTSFIELANSVLANSRPRLGQEPISSVTEGIERLDEAFREVLLLRFMEGMTYEELSRVLGLPVGTVRSRLHYGKMALMKELEDPRER